MQSDCSGFLGRSKSKSSLNNWRFGGRKAPRLAGGVREGAVQGWVGRCGAQCSLQPGAGCDHSRALPPQHQQQVLQAVERAKQVTMGELNSIVGVSGQRFFPVCGFGPCSDGGSQGFYYFDAPVVVKGFASVS